MLQSQRKLLVVDDDKMVLRFLGAGLASHFDVVTTNNPRAVPKICEVERPAVILCDVRMPDLSGPELGSMLRNNPGTRDIPIVFLTAMVEQQPLARYGSVIGGRPAISKSAELPEIISFVEQLLGDAPPADAWLEASVACHVVSGPVPSDFVQAEGFTRVH
jgi:two-component system alkaline phosphatase synthesis response regulator PhoP